MKRRLIGWPGKLFSTDPSSVNTCLISSMELLRHSHGEPRYFAQWTGLPHFVHHSRFLASFPASCRMVFSVLCLITSTKWPLPKHVQLTDPSSRALLTLGGSGLQGVTPRRGGPGAWPGGPGAIRVCVRKVKSARKLATDLPAFKWIILLICSFSQGSRHWW